MVIYRVENAEGVGPYHSCAAFSGIWGLNWFTTPAPDQDYRWVGELRNVGLYDHVVRKLHFGFPSRKAAIDWFGLDGLKEFESSGFHLKAFEVPYALKSDSGRQVMFNREQATPIGEPSEPKVSLPIQKERGRCPFPEQQERQP